MKYFIYCRRSQDREDKQTLSIKSQKRELLKYAKEKGLKVVKVISENKSAYKRGRPKFNKMMERIEKGDADAVLTWHLTRLARNGADGGLIISFMDEGMIKELRTTEKIYLNNGDDKFMMTIHFAMAKKSSDDTSAFVKNNLKTKLEKGEYPAYVPYGYLNIGDNGVIAGKRFDRKKQALLEQLGRPLKRIELDPIEAPLVRKLFELALTGAYSLPMLQEEALKLGIKGKVSGKKLAKQTIIRILTNIFYTSKFEFQEEIYQGVHEALITEKEYERVQEVLQQRSRPKRVKHDYLFATQVYCPECNNTMSGEFQKGIHYYRCARAKGKKATCSNTKHLRQDCLEKEMELALEQLVIPQSVVDWALKYLKQSYLEENKVLAGRRALLEKQRKEQKLKLERLTSKWLSDKNASGDLVSDEEYKEQKKEFQSEISNIEEQLQDNTTAEENWLTKCEAFFVRVRDLKHEYHVSDFLGKRVILNSIGARFVRKNEKMLVQVAEPFCYLLENNEVAKVSENANSVSMEPVLLKSGEKSAELSNWLGWRDSNPRIMGPEPTALPLGYTPLVRRDCSKSRFRSKYCCNKSGKIPYLYMTDEP